MRKSIVKNIIAIILLICMISIYVSCDSDDNISTYMYDLPSDEVVHDMTNQYVSRALDDKLSSREYLRDKIQLKNSVSKKVYHSVEILDKFVWLKEINKETENLCFFGTYDNVFSYMFQSAEKATVNLWAANNDNLTNPYMFSWTIAENCKEIFHINSLNDDYNLTYTEYVGVLMDNGSVSIYKQKPMDLNIIKNLGKEAQLEDYFYVRNVLDDVERVWGTNDGFAFVKEGNLYIYSLVTSKITLIKKHCKKIKDIAVAENDHDGRYYMMYIDENGELYGYGRNLAKFFCQDSSQKIDFDRPVKINTIYNLKQVHLSNMGEVYLLDENGDLFFGGIACKSNERELKRNNYRNNSDYVYFDKVSEYKTSFIEEIKNLKNLIYISKPMKIASGIQYINKGSLFKNLVYINENKEVYSCSMKRINNENKENSYVVENNLLCKEVEEMYDCGLLDCEGNVSVYLYEFYADGKNKDKYEVLPRLYWWETKEMSNPYFYSPVECKINSRINEILVNSLMNYKNIIKYVWINNFQEQDRIGIYLNESGELIASISNNAIYNYYTFPHFSYKFDGFEDYLYKYEGVEKKINNENRYVLTLEKNVDYFWADEFGVAFVKNNKLFACGAMEYYRPYIYELEDFSERYTDNKPNPLYPPYAVQYDGIEGNNVKSVQFDKYHIYITMKSGDAYKILPKQDKSTGYYEKIRTVNKKYFFRNRNVVDCGKNYVLYNNGDAEVLFYPVERFYNDIRDSKSSLFIKNVKKIIVGWNEDVYVYLEKDGSLYGWGSNCANTISAKKRTFYTYNNRVLIQSGVKDFELNGDGLYILNSDESITFRGYNGRYAR